MADTLLSLNVKGSLSILRNFNKNATIPVELFIFMDISFFIHYNSLQFDGHLVSSHLLLEAVSLEMVETMKKRSSECWCEYQYTQWSQIYNEVAMLQCSDILVLTSTQYGHSQSEKKLGVDDKYHRSIKVHT